MVLVVFCLSNLLLFLILELSLILGSGLLVLLVFGDKVVHVGLCLGELHLVHPLTSVPVEESLATEHSSELLRDALEQLLDGGGVANEGGSHLETTGWDVTDSSLDIVGDPLNKVGAVLVLDVEHLLVHLLHGHAAPEDGGNSQVPAMTWVASSHHVLGIKHLLCQLWHSKGTVLLAATRCEWGKTRHEEVETGERNHVDSKLPEVSIELARESQAGGDSRHGERDKVIQVSIGRRCELEGTEADVIEGFVVNAGRN